MIKFLTFGLLLAFIAATLAHTRRQSLQNLWDQSAKECINKAYNDKHDLLQQNNHESESDLDSHRCYDACVWEGTGLFKNNRFDLDEMVPAVWEYRSSLRRSIRLVMFICAAEVYEMGDKCEKAARFMTCYRRFVRHRNSAYTN